MQLISPDDTPHAVATREQYASYMMKLEYALNKLKTLIYGKNITEILWHFYKYILNTVKNRFN